MRALIGVVCLVALVLMAADYQHGAQQQHWSHVGKKCVSASGLSVIIGGAEVGTVTDEDFASGDSCTVIPPLGVANSVALRCYVDNAQTAHIVASTAVALGVSLGAATWCVEVRTVAPAFVE